MTATTTAAVWIAQYAIAGSLIAALAARLRNRRRFEPLLFGLGAGVAFLLTLIAAQLYQHPRPFVVMHVAPLVAHSNDNGFPSDHSVVAAYIAAYLLWFDLPVGACAAAVAVLIGVARIFCLLHWPVDIAFGWLIGIAAAVIARWLLAQLFTKTSRSAQPPG
ncbi:MAG: phosphatase PAP2 family protein [Candidatus Eremiobacter antarcticus]|nr:phosphatase PAP2 family protein [Candidatus Eremiobacteraeota bacterium]MBC5807087.1 phosphatase PAP2 family protein [Candidatus Eremiobacteraeota bacterium]